MSGPERDAVSGRFLPQDVVQRFLANTVEEDRGYVTPCLIWTAGGASGYGRFWLNGRQVGAHQFGYRLVHGPIPAGLQPDHLCRVRLCVRGSHMEAVTPGENVRRSESPFGINARLERCRRGHEFTGTWRGRRTCRTCTRDRMRKHRASKAA